MRRCLPAPWCAAAPVLAALPLAAAHAAELVSLDASPLAPGPLVNWPNGGSLGGNFTRGIDAPQVSFVAGIKAVVLDGSNDWFVGPVAPASLTGNGSRTVTAWIHNPVIDAEETLAAWGRRGGGNGTNASYTHGTHSIWGAAGQWGEVADVSWQGAAKANVWTFVAIAYDGASLTTSAYTNGLLGTAELNGPLNTWATSTGGSPLPLLVGCQNNADGSRGAVPASLSIAKLSIHDRALSAAEVAAAFNADAAAFGLAPVAVAPSIESFTASREAVYAGGSVSLAWTVHGADRLALDQGLALAPDQTSVVVSPAATTTYTLTAANAAGSATRMVTVIVDPGSPVAGDQAVDAAQDSPRAVVLTGSDPDTPPAQWVWSVVAPPAHGGLSGTAPALTYTPDPGFAGTDSFSFRIHDGISESNAATVTLRVNPPPAAPSAVTLSETQIDAGAGSGALAGLLQAADPNFGETHSFQLVAGEGDTHNALFSVVGRNLVLQGDLAGFAGTVLSVRVRAADNTGRSLDQVLAIPVVTVPPSVVINEIFPDPPDNQRSEFIELHNPAATAVDLTGWRLADAVDFAFPAGSSIPPGGFLVVAMDPAAFLGQFGFAALGPWAGRLSDEGEKIELRDGSGALVDEVEYDDEFPWPVGALGGGASMELIHPSLDNDLGGSWRSSQSRSHLPQLTYLPAASTGWRWRPGSSEASNPTTAWRLAGFAEDGSWTTARAPIGYGNVSSTAGTLALNTTISGMQNNYRCFFNRKSFTIAPGEVPANLLLRYSQDDGILVWINGTLVAQRNVATTNPTISTLGSNQANEGLWYEEQITNAATFLTEGTNTVAVQVFNTTTNSSDVGFDLELIRPAANSGASNQPSPGAANTVFATVAAPQLRQVRHVPAQPKGGEPVTVTAKVTDPQGVGQVQLLYQVVAPGSFLPARFPRTRDQILADPAGERPVNPAFEDPANWTAVAMNDEGTGGDAVAGDSVYTAVVPALAHRTLVRYRISAADLGGAATRVPHEDDPSLNFAWFAYDGMPDYVASSASVDPAGPGKVWPRQLLASVPVYHWLIRAEDMASLNAYNASQQFPNTGDDVVLAARRAEDWEGALVADGIVYDHVRVRLRGGNSRYGDNEGRFTYGKRHYKFQFNDGRRFQARDERGRPYPRKWPSLAVNKMFGNKGGNAWGMTEEIGSVLWSSFGVPAPDTHWFHFRVIDAAAEAPDQYNGDFWGLYQVVEEYEGTFLDSRGMTKGNLYKMSDWIWDAERQRRYQSPDMVRDGSEFDNIRDNLHGGQDAAWLNRHVNYPKWYRYSAVAEAIRHYDLFPYTDDLRHALKNMAWYFEPVGPDPARGVCWFMPYDWDASFGPNWNNGWEHANNALYGWDMSTSNGLPYLDKPQMKIEHRNVLREFRDLAWQPDQLLGLIDDRAQVIAALSRADQDRWRNAPLAAGTAVDDPLAAKVADMKNFCFFGWVRDGGNIGPAVPGGRDAYLDALADNPDAGLLPAKPVITYAGLPGFPVDGLAFRTGAFSDPQGPATFAALQWRIGEIENPAAPAFRPDDDYKLEVVPVWESGALTVWQDTIAIPGGALRSGHTYRARVRLQDNTDRWSHWSEPVQFTTTTPDEVAVLAANLMITEIMYHPAGPAPEGGSAEDYEFVELQNVSDTLTLDLTGVRFTKGIDFDFAGGAIASLPPGARVLVVKDLAAFQSRYGNLLPVAGQWDAADNLANGGEQLKLSYLAGAAIHDFAYDDEAPWPVAADGDGPSLVLIDPVSRPDHGLAANWRASSLPFGSPGSDDTPFAAWLAARGASDPLADPDGDGIGHLLLFALGGDLLPDPRAALPRVFFTEESGGAVHLALAFRRRAGDTGVTIVPELSSDLVVWQDDPGLLEQAGPPLDHGDGTETVTFRVLAPVDGSGPECFVRLRVNWN